MSKVNAIPEPIKSKIAEGVKLHLKIKYHRDWEKQICEDV